MTKTLFEYREGTNEREEVQDGSLGRSNRKEANAAVVKQFHVHACHIFHVFVN